MLEGLHTNKLHTNNFYPGNGAFKTLDLEILEPADVLRAQGVYGSIKLQEPYFQIYISMFLLKHKETLT